MDSTPPAEPGNEQELLDAISLAARHVGTREDQDSSVVVRFDAAPPGRRRLLTLWATLAVVAAGAAFLSLRTRGDPPALQQEEDLRWAVGQVVRRVESLRAQTGVLPTADALHGLLSELVVYDQYDGVYIVVGRRGGVQVVYDGSVPLDLWLTQSQGDGR